jgi:chemotaxis protein methyltransferase CheR
MFDRLHERHFSALARLIEDHTGIRLPPNKKTMVEGRLRKRLRVLGLSTLNEYGEALFEHGFLDEEFIYVIDCVTTNKTDFFREPDHFDYLRDKVLPLLLAMPHAADGPLKFWSAAASIGAEAYTIAMVVADALASTSRRRLLILGTDISTEVIGQARRAVYPAAMGELIPAEMSRRFIMRSVKKDQQEIRVVPEIRQLAEFRRMNLMDAKYPVDRDFDVVFCRNILIYFDQKTQNEVLSRLCRHLRRGGYLFLGHSESLAGSGQKMMQQIAPTIFRRMT